MLAALLACALLPAGGCASAPSASDAVVRIDAERYDEAFDETIELLRDEGLDVVVRDRRGGLIETGGRTAGSLFEPWRADESDFAGTLENTIAWQRRRAIVELRPLAPDGRVVRDLAPSEPDDRIMPIVPPGGAAPLDEPDERGSEIEIDVRVVLERAFTPGLRRNDWTRVETTFTRDPLRDPPRDDDELIERARWTPVARDRTFEWRLARALASRLDVSVDDGAVGAGPE